MPAKSSAGAARRAGSTISAVMTTRLAATAIAIRASRGSIDTGPRYGRWWGASTLPTRTAMVAARLVDTPRAIHAHDDLLWRPRTTRAASVAAGALGQRVPHW